MPSKRSHSPSESHHSALTKPASSPTVSHVSKYSRAGSISSSASASSGDDSEASDGRQDSHNHGHNANGTPLPTSKLAYRGPRRGGAAATGATATAPSSDSTPTKRTDTTPKHTVLKHTKHTKHTIHCSLPPHPLFTFRDVAAFERHYAKEHAHRCTSCGANFPEAQLLEVHLSDRHDPIVASQRERGEKTFRCFLAACDKLCRDPARRRLHLIDKHRYPREYDFRIVVHGLKAGQTSLLRPRPGPRERAGGVIRRDGTGRGHERGAKAQGDAAAEQTSTATAKPQAKANAPAGRGGIGRGQRKGFLGSDRRRVRGAADGSGSAQRVQMTNAEGGSTGSEETSDESDESHESDGASESGDSGASDATASSPEGAEGQDADEEEADKADKAGETDDASDEDSKAREVQRIAKRPGGAGIDDRPAARRVANDQAEKIGEVESLTQRMGALQFVPMSVQRPSRPTQDGKRSRR